MLQLVMMQTQDSFICQTLVKYQHVLFEWEDYEILPFDALLFFIIVLTIGGNLLETINWVQDLT